MASILVNPSALTALQALRATQAALATTQKEVSTGLKISSAADNASTWAIAETMKSDKKVLSTIADSLSGANSVLNVAAAAVKSALNVMNDIKTGIAQAQQPGADTAKILTSLQQLGKQLTSVVSSATFTGINATDGSNASPLKFIASYTDGGGSAASSVGTIDLTLKTLIDSGGGGTGVLEAAQATGAAAATDFTGLVAADLGSSKIADTLSNADQAIADLTTYAAEIGATQTRVTQQNEFIQTMSEALMQAAFRPPRGPVGCFQCRLSSNS
jgi:flagellin